MDVVAMGGEAGEGKEPARARPQDLALVRAVCLDSPQSVANHPASLANSAAVFVFAHFSAVEPSARPAPAAARRKRGKSAGSARATAAALTRCFDATAGVYRVEVGGQYVVRVGIPKSVADEDTRLFVSMGVWDAVSDSIEYVHIPRQGHGQLHHLGEGDKLWLQLSLLQPQDTPPDPCPAVTWSVELAMRKRKLPQKPKPRPSRGARAETGKGEIGGGEGEEEGKEGKKRGQEGQTDGGKDDEEIGSDTEWEEGFSSDDEHQAKRRAPRDVRRLQRKLADQQLSDES